MATFKKATLPFGNSGYPSSGAVNIYTQPLTKSSVVVGLSVSNTSNFDIPCDVYLIKGGSSAKHYFARDRRVKAGETIQLIDSGQKVVLEADAANSDAVWANGYTHLSGANPQTFSCWLSYYEDVNA
ncbi:MAG: hypothetical protein CMB24_01670 [Euryarchaeota archaeon]|nr:hypothetical protein [Euryarchaeota archaeon]|tara:strand:- start:3150 stop:3530 length:381 start_codon:yes stop_codon:yes gene_type:complete